MPNVAFEPGDEICPPWWPQLLWELHLPHHGLGGGGGGNPVNYPPALNDILAALSIHTFSYLLLDQKLGQSMRTQAEGQIVTTVKQMSALHDKNVGKSR